VLLRPTKAIGQAIAIVSKYVSMGWSVLKSYLDFGYIQFPIFEVGLPAMPIKNE
jgi:hypothetical protein